MVRTLYSNSSIKRAQWEMNLILTCFVGSVYNANDQLQQ